ncbi:MAG: TetR/AcrR family transcriptional regulator [Myxococcota bacterium]
MALSNAAPTLPATSRGQRTRTRLLDAAEQVFGEQGYERASIVEITQSAGVAQGTFYVYFESKKSIFIELVDTLGTRLRRSLGEAIAGITDRLEIERTGFRAFLVFVEEHKHLYKIVRQCEFVDEAVYRAYYRRMADAYVKGLKGAMRDGEFHKLHPEAIAYALMGIFDFVGMRWVLWEGTAPPRKAFNDVFAFIAHGLSATPLVEGTG